MLQFTATLWKQEEKREVNNVCIYMLWPMSLEQLIQMKLILRAYSPLLPLKVTYLVNMLVKICMTIISSNGYFRKL